MSSHMLGDNLHGKDLEHYEGDQSALYSGSLHADIKSEESKAKVKKIWQVTGILTIVTIVEVCFGLLGLSWGMPRWSINTLFLILTLFKAAYIVSIFMHLGHEIKNMILTILIPLTLFIWFIIAFLADGHFWLWISTTLGKAL